MAMTATAFDTLSYARRLKEAGVDEAQAEAVRDAVTEGVATKADLKATAADIRAAFKAAVAALKADTLKLKADMLKVAIGIVIANAGLTVALVKLLP